MAGKKVGYIRVSSVDQNPDRQLDSVELDKKFIDMATGAHVDRPQYQAMMQYLRDDDILYIHSLDRLARNTRDLLTTVDELIKRGITVIFVKENLTFDANGSNPMSKMILTIIAAIAEFELALIKERQMEGINRAKALGVYSRGGRKSLMCDVLLEKIDTLMTTTRYSKSRIARECCISRRSLYTYLKEINRRKEESGKIICV